MSEQWVHNVGIRYKRRALMIYLYVGDECASVLDCDVVKHQISSGDSSDIELICACIGRIRKILYRLEIDQNDYSSNALIKPVLKRLFNNYEWDKTGLNIDTGSYYLLWEWLDI